MAIYVCMYRSTASFSCVAACRDGLRRFSACQAIILSLSGIVVVLLQDAVAFIGDLVGILPANGVCVIFPCAALLQMYGHEMRTWQRIGVRALVILFSLYSVLGTLSTVRERLAM